MSFTYPGASRPALNRISPRIRPGEKVDFGNPNHPNTSFDAFLRAMCSQIGAALGIAAEELLMQFNSSYSASRAALMESWKGYKMRREWIVSDLCRPVYELWFSDAVALGRVSAPGFFDDPLKRAAWLGSEWIGPSQGQLDPVKEVTAEILAVKHGFSTHEKSTVKLGGGDLDDNVAQLLQEAGKLQDIHARELDVEYLANRVMQSTIADALREIKEEGDGNNE